MQLNLVHRVSHLKAACVVIVLAFSLSGCVVGAVVGAGATVASETVKAGAKVTGGAVGAASDVVFGDDDEDEKKDKDD